ncbi:MAG: hypothetical protein A2543_00270 [Candidatus Komeilibacteria bacterium RIFOXYD2_FULL_37_8]|nr:MAG: hypothetical protein A2543_00270 [Candidatus Komeilibacteria bacterium RIFOXYD2_FULL_37_8]
MTVLFAFDLGKFSWLGLLMHLLPTLVLVIILGISWVQEKIGGILWILAALTYVVIAWGDVNWLAYLLMAGPAIVIGGLFLWSSFMSGGNTSLPKLPKLFPNATPSSKLMEKK